jgi:hypothetical protein
LTICITNYFVFRKRGKYLGTVTGRKRVNFGLKMPTKVAVYNNSTQVKENKFFSTQILMNETFQNQDSSTRNQDLKKIKPCYVRLERIKIPTEAVASIKPALNESSSGPQKLVQDSTEEDDMV